MRALLAPCRAGASAPRDDTVISGRALRHPFHRARTHCALAASVTDRDSHLLLEHVDATLARHTNVEEHDMRPFAADDDEGLLSVGCLPDDLNSFSEGKE